MVQLPDKETKAWRIAQLSKLTKKELIEVYKSKLAYEFSDIDALPILKEDLVDFLSNVLGNPEIKMLVEHYKR